MNFRVSALNLQLTLAVASISATAWAYVVKKGDTLSRIAAKNISEHVYGKNGSLRKLIALNPHIQNPNLIFPGISIVLPIDEQTVATRNPQSLDTPKVDSDPVMSRDAITQTEEPTKIGSWRFEADYASSKIHSIDASSNTSANILTNSNLGLRFFWTQDWSDRFKTALSSGLRRWSLIAPSVASLSEKTPLLYKFSVETHWKLTNRASIVSGAAYDQEINLTGANLTTIGVETVSIPKLKIGAYYDLARIGPYAIGLTTENQVLFPGKSNSYNTKLGYAYNAGTYIVMSAKTKSIKAHISYESKTTSTNQSRQNEANIVFGIGVSFPIVVPKNELNNGEAKSYDY